MTQAEMVIGEMVRRYKLLEHNEINDNLIEYLIDVYIFSNNNNKKCIGFMSEEIRNLSDKVVKEMIANRMVRSIIKKIIKKIYLIKVKSF